MMTQEHLGDGAYFSYDERAGDGYITANHHDPVEATDCVYLNCNALPTLRRLLNEILVREKNDGR